MKLLSFLLCLLFSILSSSATVKITTYSGTIKGYTTTQGFKTGTIIANNVVTGINESYLININADGSFSTSFPLNYDKQCWISFPFFQQHVYFVHGGALTQNFDISVVPKVTSTFTGDGAVVNTDLQKINNLYHYDWDKIYNDVNQLSPEAFKSYFLSLQAEKIQLVNRANQAHKMDKKAYFLALNYIKNEIAGYLIFYNSTIESAYRIKNKIPFEDRTPVLKRVILPESYYDFLQDLKYNDPANMALGNYGMFINRFTSIDLIYDKAGRIDHTNQINMLEKKDVLTAEDKEILKMIKQLNGLSVNTETLKKVLPEVLSATAKTDVSLELDFVTLQQICLGIQDSQTPLPDTTLSKIKRTLKNPALFSELLDLNNKIKQTIEGNKTQTGFVLNQTPEVTADGVFENILRKYKGKTIFVDFWATWCSPCLVGIQEMAPMKAELKDEDIVFLYITNHTSPISSYNAMVPGIKGEHYRLTSDQYNVISTTFGIHGIPHYMVVNKNGEIVDKRFNWQNSQQVKARLLKAGQGI